MIINKNKEATVLIFSNITSLSIDGEVELVLVNSATNAIINYSITPIEATSRFISIDSKVLNDLGSGMYYHELKYGTKAITSGILRVIEESEEGVITPEESPIEGDSEVVYYNGE